MKNSIHNVSRKAALGRGVTASTANGKPRRAPAAAEGCLPTANAAPPDTSARPEVSPAAKPPGRYKSIKLAVDVHADFFVAARQIENESPQRPRKFTPDEFIEYVREQLTLADAVHTCYEAGCFGFGLHRELEKMGVKNLVLRPMKLDEQKKNVRTDRTDAMEMCLRLDRYVAGSRKALAVVRVPAVEEELRRGRSRLRGQLLKDRKRAQSRGRSHLLYHGVRVCGKWWMPASYESIEKQVRQKHPADAAERILAMLRIQHDLAVFLDNQVGELTAELCKRGKEHRGERRVKGIGDLSAEVMSSEICDWDRFKNRRQVASYTGLCPSVSGSGGHFTQGSVTKVGNPRLRYVLIELAWLMVWHQRNYRAVKKWSWAFEKQTPRSVRKKAIVAIARMLAVDLWRIATERARAEDLGLTLTDAPKPKKQAKRND